MKLACEEVAKVISVDEDYGTYDLKFEHDIFSDEDDYQFIDDWLEKFEEKRLCRRLQWQTRYSR